ncbi:hypothetical protein [Gryllotalpicola protaetiae]|uniref:hypothetical protein n=1 Tax=Gryllotalpicola protaetiae TaxID=2419771 RepID=UPI0013C4B2D6|nr:hypothetical protein [Gryllotalpicola protaetiae]
MGVIRSRKIYSAEASGSDQAAVRAELLAGVPGGFEAERIWGVDQKTGTLEIRAGSRETQELVVDAPSYPESRRELEASFDAGDWQLISSRID